jgi:hypothetical protein
MEAGAGGRLHKLAHDHIEVALQLPLQRKALFEFAAKRCSRHAQCRAFALHQGVQRRNIHPE